jgi:hypothetical protein
MMAGTDAVVPAWLKLAGLVAASSAKTAGFGVASSVPQWRATVDEDGHYSFAIAL